ncbi:hypothetical protein BKA83DRAFT_4276969, partial [Pisolithus microcarpus]
MKSPLLIGTDLAVERQRFSRTAKSFPSLRIQSSAPVLVLLDGASTRTTLVTTRIPRSIRARRESEWDGVYADQHVGRASDHVFQSDRVPWIRAAMQYSVGDLWAHSDNRTAVRHFAGYGVSIVLSCCSPRVQGDEVEGSRPPCTVTERFINQRGVTTISAQCHSLVCRISVAVTLKCTRC